MIFYYVDDVQSFRNGVWKQSCEPVSDKSAHPATPCPDKDGPGRMTALGETRDSVLCKSIERRQVKEGSPVEPAETLTRADPQEALRVLKEGTHTVGDESLFRVVPVDGKDLGACRTVQESHRAGQYV
jgi:hypothetical protein